jgi:sigma-B regulation protein RsbU (phosphoserine phosphatase)
VLGKRLESSFFATGVFLKISKESIMISNAGHNAPLLIRSDGGDILELERDGPPLGMVEDYEYEFREIPVFPGDRLLVYSDGLVETISPDGQQFGLDTVKQIIRDGRGMSNEELKTVLAETLDKHAGGHYTDDVSILLLEIPP